MAVDEVTPPSAAGGGESAVLLRQGMLYTLSAAAPVLSTLVITPLLTRSIPAEEYGRVGLALVVIQIGIVVLGFGLQEPIARAGIMGASGIAGAKGLVLLALGPSALTAALVVATGPLWFAPLVGARYGVEYGYALGAAWLFSLIAALQGVMRAQDRPLPLVAVGLLASALAPGFGLALVAWREPNAASYLLGTVIGYAVALAVGVADFLRGDRPHGEWKEFADALRLGLPMIAHQVAVYLATAVVVVASSRRLGVVDAGRMQLALYVGTAPAIIAVAMSNSWSPLIYRTEPKRRPAVASRLASDVASVIAVLTGGLVLLLPVVLPFLMPAGYDPIAAVPAATIAAVGAIFFVAYLASVHLMMTMGRNGVLGVIVPASIAVGAGVAAAVPADFTLLAAAFPAATVSLAVGARLALPRVSSVVWDVGAVAPQVLAVLGLGAAGLLLPTGGVWLVVRVVAAAGVGLVGLRFLRSTLAQPAAD